MDQLLRTARRHPRRTGVATLWIVLSLPVLVIALCVVVDIGNLWIARAELENSLEASSLAAVKAWEGSSEAVNWTNIARQRGTDLAGANLVRGAAVSISMNQGTYNNVTNPNENDLYDVVKGPPAAGNLIFGGITEDLMGALTMDTSVAPSGGPVFFGVRAQASVPVQSLCGSVFGLPGGQFCVSAKATAMITSTGQVRLVRIDQFTSP